MTFTRHRALDLPPHHPAQLERPECWQCDTCRGLFFMPAATMPVECPYRDDSKAHKREGQ